MGILLKPLVFIAFPLLIIAGVIWGIGALLSTDDLSDCDAPVAADMRCAPADVIVAISGGDTDARTSEAVRLYRQGWAQTLIFSGAALDTASISNASAMRTLAIQAGVPASAIQVDEIAVDTAGNAQNISDIARRDTIKRLILVTSPYHQRRAGMEFAKALGPDVTILNHPTRNDRYWPATNWWMNPFSWWLALSETVKIVYISLPQ